MTKDLIIIHGSFPSKNLYRKIIKVLSQDYNVHFFEYDWRKSIAFQVQNLSGFIKSRKIEEANFLTHSFGSVILNAYCSHAQIKSERAVELAPLNQGSKLLERIYELGTIGNFMFGAGGRDFISNKIGALPPKPPLEVGVIAGSKRFSFGLEYYVIPLIINNKDSDGKVFIRETKFDGMKDFSIVHENHSFLMCNDEVIEKTKNFFKTGFF